MHAIAQDSWREEGRTSRAGSALDLVQDSLRRFLADGMSGITENDQGDPTAIPFGDFGPLAVRIGAAVDQSCDARNDRGVHGLVSGGAGLHLPPIELEVMRRRLFVAKLQYQPDTRFA